MSLKISDMFASIGLQVEFDKLEKLKSDLNTIKASLIQISNVKLPDSFKGLQNISKGISKLRIDARNVVNNAIDNRNINTQKTFNRTLNKNIADQRIFNRTINHTKTILNEIRGRGLNVSSGVVGTLAAGWGITEVVSGIFNANAQSLKWMQTLKVVTGSLAAAKEEMTFVRDLSDKSGASVRVVAEGYSKIAAAAKGTDIAGKGIRDLMTAVTKTAGLMGASEDDMMGAFKGIRQIISKQKVQAEEWTGQIGERMVQATQLVAKEMGIAPDEFFEKMEDGALDVNEVLTDLTKALKRELTPEAEKELANTPFAWLNRVKSEWFLLQESIGGFNASSSMKGFLRTVVDLLRKLRENGGAIRQVFAIIVNTASSLLRMFFSIGRAIFGAFSQLTVFGDTFSKLFDIKDPQEFARMFELVLMEVNIAVQRVMWSFEEWFQSLAGQTSIKDFFSGTSEAAKGAHEIAGAIVAIAKAINLLATAKTGWGMLGELLGTSLAQSNMTKDIISQRLAEAGYDMGDVNDAKQSQKYGWDDAEDRNILRVLGLAQREASKIDLEVRLSAQPGTTAQVSSATSSNSNLGLTVAPQ